MTARIKTVYRCSGIFEDWFYSVKGFKKKKKLQNACLNAEEQMMKDE